jgi:hypothetical protein
LESQRVRLLTKGYLRGWLDFEYTQKCSGLRESIILYSLQQEEYEDLLREKLHKDAVLVSGIPNKTEKLFNIVDKSYELYIQLKLPELAKELKIGDKKAIPNQSFSEMKALLAAANAAAKAKETNNNK